MSLKVPAKSSYHQYLEGGGEMGALTRSFNWSKTALGAPENWSQSLLTAISIMLNSRFPMFLWWGPELVQFYNDAYRPSLGIDGKHPDALGQRGEDCWPEIWAIIKPLIDQVLAGGESTWSEDQLIPIFRNNRLEDVYWTFSYSKVSDETGKPAGVLVICNETTEQVKARKAIERAEEMLRLAIDSAELGTWYINAETRQFIPSQRLKEIFGYYADEDMTYDSATSQITEEFRDTVAEMVETAIQTGVDFYEEYTIRRFHDRQLRWLRATGKLYPSEKDQPAHFSGTITDITERKAQEERKDEFLSIASHELKTPLTSIKAYNQIMKRTNDAEKLQGFVRKSADHIARLEKLINDLLDVTKINAGKMDYNMQPFNFEHMLRECIESAQHIAPSHHFVLENAACDLNYTGDRFRLEQVLNNFLTNAIKYSPKSKKVIVGCKIEPGNVIVSVQDFGIGIAPESLDRLFERYYRVDNTAMRFEGLGLGLFISSEILKRHKGSFWIDSELGKGSTFFFRLPLSDDKKPGPVKNSPGYYQDSTITVAYNADYSRLDVDWTGFQNLESVQHGCMLMLEMMQKNKAFKIVNDNTHVLGSWSEAVEWTGNEWFPMMEKAGLKYFALIYSPSVFSQLSAKKSIDVGIGSITAQYFTEIALAEAWVNQCPS